MARAMSRSALAASSVPPLLRGQRLGRWSVEPGCEQAGVPPPGGRGKGDDGHVHGDAAVAQVGPESVVLVDPAAQFAVGVPAGVDVDEAGGRIVGGDGEFEGEVAPGAPVPGAVEPVWEQPAAEAATREVADLLHFGGEPREGGLSKHVLEGEKTTEQDDVPRRPAIPDVFDAEGAVEAPAVDAGVPETGRVSRKGILTSEAGLDEAVDEGVGGPRGAAVMSGELPPDEDAGMEADEGEPGGRVGRKAEGAERGVSTAQVGTSGGVGGTSEVEREALRHPEGAGWSGHRTHGACRRRTSPTGLVGSRPG